MAKKDFSNTQTGGVGTTPQVGDKPTETVEIKKEQGRPKDLTKGEGVDPVATDGEPKKQPVEEKPKVTEEPKTPIPTQPELELGVQEDVERQEEPLIEPLIESEDKSESSVALNDFYIPEHEETNELLEAKGKASFFVPGSDVEPEIPEQTEITPEGEPEKKPSVVKTDSLDRVRELYKQGYRPKIGDRIEGAATLAEIENTWIQGRAVDMALQVEPEPPGKIYNPEAYPDRDYKIIDGFWHYRKRGSDEEWSKSKSADARGLNYYYRNYPEIQAKIPEALKPPKGGVDFEGTKVYGNPYQGGTVYTIQDGRWYKVDQGEKDWEAVDSDKTIKALNNYHGTEIMTNSERERSRAATAKPPTMEAFEEEKAPQSVSDVSRMIEQASKPEPPREKDVTEKTGEVLEERGMPVGEALAEGLSPTERAKIEEEQARDMGGDVGKMYSTGADMLFIAPRPKDDPIAQRQWDEKNGGMFGALGPTGENVETAIKQQEEIVEAKNKALEYQKSQGYDEDSPQYKAEENMFDKLIEESQEKIEKEQAGLETQRESFKNHLDYKQSPEYAANVYNSPYSKIQRAQQEIENLSYGAYDAEKKASAWLELAMAEEEISRDKLSNFVNLNVDEFYANTNMTDGQKAQIKNAQKIAKGIVDKPIFMPGEAQRVIEETYSFLEESRDVNNRLLESYNQGKDLSESLLDVKKISMEQNKDWIPQETKDIFYSTLEIHEFVADYVESGDIVIDPVSGVYSVSEDADPYVKDYITKRLEQLMANYTEAKSKIYSNNRQVIEEKNKELKMKQTTLAFLKTTVESGSKTWNDDLRAKASSLQEEIDALKREIRSLRSDGDTVFLNDPNKISLNTASNATSISRQIFQALPDNVTPKQKFDMFYERLVEKNKQLREEHGIQESRLDAYGETVRDMLNWGGPIELTRQEKDWHKNRQMIKQLAPLYYTNDWGITQESGGFWNSFMTSFGKFISPSTGKYWNETDAAATVKGMIADQGFTEEDFADGFTMSKLDDRMDIDFWSKEGFGGMVGTSAAIMVQLMMATATTGGILKETGNIIRLLERSKKLGDFTKSAREFQRLQKVFKETMANTRTGRYFYESGQMGVQFELAGTYFPNAKEELAFMNGMAGAMAGKFFEAIFRHMKPSTITQGIGSMFGGSTDKAVALFKRMGDWSAVNVAKATHYRGLGEMPEEFAQELSSIYRNELEGRGFFEAVNDRYFKDAKALDRFEELLISSYILGLGMGTVMSTFQGDLWNEISPERKSLIEQALKDVEKDFSTGKANVDIEAGRIVNNEEALEAETKTEKDAVQERKTEEVDVAEEARTGEGVVEEDQEAKTPEEVPTEERINAKTLEEATRLHEQGYRPEIDGKVDKEASVAELANFFFTRPSIDMVKPAEPTAQSVFQDFMAKAKEDGLTLDEAAARAEQEGTFDDDINFQEFIKGAKDSGLTLDEAINRFEETRDMSLADKIRALKQGADPNTMYGSLIPISLINKAVNTVLEGAALTAENVQKFIDYIKKSKEYLNAKAEKRANMDAELEQLSEYLASQEAAKDAPKTITELSDVASVSKKMTEEQSDAFNESAFKSKKAQEVVERLGEPVGIIETQDGYTLIYEELNEDGFLIGREGIKVKRNKDGSISKRATVLDSDATAKEIEQSRKFLSPKKVKPTEAVKSIKEKVAQFRRGFIEGEKAQKKLSKEEAKAKKEAIEEIQKELTDYVTKNLLKKADIPEGASYNKNDIRSMMTKIRDAKDGKSLKKAMDAVDKIVDRFAEQNRVNTVNSILEKLANKQQKERGGKKVSRISKSAREKLGALAEDVGLENIPNMTQEELTTLETRVDAIIAGGKEQVKAKEEEKKEERMTERNVPFEVLTKQNKNQATDEKSGQQIYRENVPLRKRVTRKAITDPIQAAARTLESRLMDVYRGSKELREWARKNILEATNKAYRDRDNGRLERLDIIEEKLAEIFPKGIMGMPSKLKKKSSVNIGSTKTKLNGENEVYNWFKGNKGAFSYDERLFTSKSSFDNYLEKTGKTYESIGTIPVIPEGQVDLINDQVVRIHNMARVDAKPIYKVGDQLFDNESRATEAAKAQVGKLKKGATTEEKAEHQKKIDDAKELLTDEYNSNILRQISNDGSLEDGLKKISEVNNAVQSDEALKAWADFAINDFYVSAKGRYEPKFEDIYDMGMREGPYVPMTRSISPEMDENMIPKLLGDTKKTASSAMSNHLKTRYSNSSAKFDFSKGSLQMMLEYTNSMEHAMAFLPVAESMRNLMNKAVKPQVIAKIGKNRTKELQSQMNDIISDGGELMKGTSEGVEFVNTVLKWKVVSTLALKTGSIPKQFTSATHWIGAGIQDGVGPVKVMKEIVNLTENISGLTNEELEVISAIWNDAFTQNRMSGKDIDFEVRKLHRAMENKNWENVRDIATRIGMLPTVVGDMGGVLIGGVPFTMAQYRNNVNNKGMDHKEAMEEALYKYTQVANETQQSTRRDQLSNLQTSKIMRLFFTFKTSQVAAMSRFLRAAKVLSDKKGEYSNAEKGQAAYDTMYYVVAQSLFVAVANGTVGMIKEALGLEDDDEKGWLSDLKDPKARELRDTALYQLVMDNMSSNLQGLGMPGFVVDWVLNHLRNRNVFNNIPVVDMLEDLTSGTGSLTRVLTDGGDPTKDVSESEYKNFMKVLGVKNIQNAWDSYNQWDEGKIDSWDAFMGRTMEEDKRTGEEKMYHTGTEREDWIYEKVLQMIYGDELPELGTPWRSEAEERMEGDINLTPQVPTLESGEELIQRQGMGVSTKEYTDVETPIERKYRNAAEIEARKRIEESREKPSTIPETAGSYRVPSTAKTADIPKTKDMSGSAIKTKSDEEIRKETTNNWSKIYKDKFGEAPPKKSSLNSIMMAVINKKKL
jgi:hypothetical protein